MNWKSISEKVVVNTITLLVASCFAILWNTSMNASDERLKLRTGLDATIEVLNERLVNLEALVVELRDSGVTTEDIINSVVNTDAVDAPDLFGCNKSIEVDEKVYYQEISDLVTDEPKQPGPLKSIPQAIKMKQQEYYLERK